MGSHFFDSTKSFHFCLVTCLKLYSTIARKMTKSRKIVCRKKLKILLKQIVSSLEIADTWSHNYGNYEGMIRSDNGQDDAGITTLFDFAGLLDGAYGDLPNDRRHVIKVFGTYEFFSDWQASFSGSFRDGRPRNAFGIHPTDSFAASYGVASFFNQGIATSRGSLGRTKNVINFDLGLQYQKIINKYKFNFRMDVFNIFDSHTVTEVDEFADAASGESSATFGLPTWFQRPRAVRFSLTCDFTP